MIAGRRAARLAGLTATAIALVALAYRRPFSYRVDVGANDTPYVDGFEAREKRGDLDWRWSDGWSRLIFHNAGQLVTRPYLRVRLGTLQPLGGPTERVSLALGKTTLAAFEAPRALTVMEFPIDPRGLGSQDWILSFSSDVFERGGGRRLGALVDWAELVSSGTPRLPPWPTTAFFALSAISLYLLLEPRCGARLAWRLCLGGELVGACGLVWAREATVALLPGMCAALVVAGSAGLFMTSRWPDRIIAAAEPRSRMLLPMGLAFAFGGQILLSTAASQPAGLALLLLGVVALVATVPCEDACQRGPAASTEWALLGVTTALALFYRLYRLGEVPFAIFRDEARHGSIALEIWASGSLPPLFLGPPINQPLPYFVVLAAAFRLLGSDLFALRLVSAVAGAASVPVAWWFVREIAGSRVALAAAFGLAASSWHVSISRYAVNYVESTLFTLPAYLFLLRGHKNGRLRDFVLCGLFAGLAQYAAHTAKSALLVLAAMVVDRAVAAFRGRQWKALRRLAARWAVAAGVGTLVLAPLVREVYRAPEAYTSRMHTVSIWEEANAEGQYPLTLLVGNVRGYLGAFNVKGDANGRHHMPGEPLLDPGSAACLALGAALLLARLGQQRHRFLLYWSAGGIVPGLATVDAPTATRIMEAAPALYTLAALGAVSCWERAAALGVARRFRRAAAAVLVASVLVYNGWLYFGAMYRSPSVWAKFAPVSTHLGQALQDLDAAGNVAKDAVLYVPTAFVLHPDEVLVLRFFMPRLDVRAFDTGPFAPRRGDLIVVPNYRDLWRLVAQVTPRYAPRASEAASDLARWRVLLGSYLSVPSIQGPPFPATAQPTFWLYSVG